MSNEHDLGPIPREMGGMPLGRSAMWWVIASEVVIFGALVACFLLYKWRHPEWSEMAAMTSSTLGAVNTTVLLTSSFFVVMAHDYATRGDRKNVALFMGLTILCGFGFLTVKSIEYATEISHGFTMSSHLFWSFYFCLTGLHGLHVIAGMIALAWVTFAAERGQQMHRIELAGLYWHFVDLVWIFLFPLLYIAK